MAAPVKVRLRVEVWPAMGMTVVDAVAVALDRLTLGEPRLTVQWNVMAPAGRWGSEYWPAESVCVRMSNQARACEVLMTSREIEICAGGLDRALDGCPSLQVNDGRLLKNLLWNGGISGIGKGQQIVWLAGRRD